MSPRKSEPEAVEPDAVFQPEPDESPNGNGNGAVEDGSMFGPTSTDGIEEETRPEASPEDEERAPVQRAGKRASAARIFAQIWGGIGSALAMSGTDVPVGRVLQLQAPMVGQKFDAMFAHTWADDKLQPIIKSAEEAEGIGALVLLPLLIGAYERNPSAGPVIYPILRQAVEANIVDLAPAMRKKRADQRRLVTAISELTTEFDIPPGMDPIDAIIQSFFAGAPGFTTEAEEATEPEPDA